MGNHVKMAKFLIEHKAEINSVNNVSGCDQECFQIRITKRTLF